VRFAARPGGDRSKRPVREIVGVDPRLNQRWSARRQVIDVRKAELAAAFAQDHGRPPGRVEMLQLAQQATLETRNRRHEPRTLTNQRAVWRTEAIEILGGGHAIEAMLRRTLNPPDLRPVPSVTADWLALAADRVVAALEEHRATWHYWHLWTETQRQLRGCAIHPADTADVAATVVQEAINQSGSRRSMTRPVCRTSCAGPTVRRCSPSPAVTSTPRCESWALSSVFWPLRTAPTAGS
jgi:hypothetical protein